MAETNMSARAVRRAAWSALAALAASGCYHYDAAQVNAFLQIPRSEVSGAEYRVYPPDVISISSRDVGEINGLSMQVRPDGKINLPLLGEIAVAGKTPAEIEALLSAAAKDYYEKVGATVQVMGYNSQKFYVMGQVSRPGPMPWTGRDTILDALAKAGPTDLAWPERILVVRPERPTTGGHAAGPSEEYRKKGVHPPGEDKPRHTMVINLMAMVESGDMANNVLLKPDDIIYVQPNPFAAVGLKLQQILFPTRPIIEAVRVPATVSTAASPGQ